MANQSVPPTEAASSTTHLSSSTHLAAAHAAYERLFAELPSQNGYALSVAGAERLGLPRVTDALDLTYGDVPFLCMAEVLQVARPAPNGLLVDLGSGVGRGVVAAALISGCARCRGVELLPDLHQAACEPAKRFERLRELVVAGKQGDQLAGLDLGLMASAIELLCSDLFDVSCSGADVVFVCCVTWGAAIMQRLAEKLAAELSAGARVATVGQSLPSFVDLGNRNGAVHFLETWRSVQLVEWGRECFFLHEVVRVGELQARRYRKQHGTLR